MDWCVLNISHIYILMHYFPVTVLNETYFWNWEILLEFSPLRASFIYPRLEMSLALCSLVHNVGLSIEHGGCSAGLIQFDKSVYYLWGNHYRWGGRLHMKWFNVFAVADNLKMFLGWPMVNWQTFDCNLHNIPWKKDQIYCRVPKELLTLSMRLYIRELRFGNNTQLERE